ncbi:unnamed protein product, partial [Mesorhabditis belari]|uniref:Peptidase S9 prolyl oligopeptidase catalytic domain-containing protein n=1 Tax=Mesorhabditis belari TaxID=2138241 RepID=A0AAF3EB06_9BILA
MATVAEFGSWKSTITPEVFSQGNAKAICQLQANSDGVYWVEQNILTGKRELFQRHYEPFDHGKDIPLAQGYSVQNSVHEYGGGALTLHSNGTVFFTTNDGVFRLNANGDVDQIIDGQNKTFRFADLSAHSKFLYAVCEDHSGGHLPENYIVQIDVQEKTFRQVVKGCDFYASPRVNREGNHLVWMQWNHINMPWDETMIGIATINNEGNLENERVLLDGTGQKINYYCPAWSPNGELLAVSDRTNFWNVYRVALNKTDANGQASLHNIFPIDAEIGYPHWQFANAPFSTNGRNTLFNVNGELKFRSNDLVLSIDLPDFTDFSHLDLTENDVAYCIASGPKRASSLLKIELNDENYHCSILREARDADEIEDFPISIPEKISFKSDDVTVSGWFYAPKNDEYSGLPGTLPPVILMGHGGPTAPATNALDFKKQFFTSRGFAVFDVNYRGSTGFGTEFRRKLYGKWGIVDRDDMIAGAQMLIERGLVDAKRVAIMGSSAGGYLLLSCLIHEPNVFAAAVSTYGVADLEGLVKDSHKFELGYNEVCIAKYPDEINIYHERSPIRHVERLNTPAAFFHGTDDVVVPASQSIQMFEALREKGLPTALKLFPGEGHGFRNANVVKEANEGAYYFFCKVMGIEPSVQSDLEIVNLANQAVNNGRNKI